LLAYASLSPANAIGSSAEAGSGMPLQLCASGFAAARPLQLAIVAATRMTEFTSMWASSGGRAYRLTVRNGLLADILGRAREEARRARSWIC
jgi:hypothetical protein